MAKGNGRKKGKKAIKKPDSAPTGAVATIGAKYPRHSLEQALRIPKAILDQNAGKPCTEKEAASFTGVSYSGDFSLEISSAIKYGLLERPEKGKIQPSERARRILRPQSESDELLGLREAIQQAPGIADVYKHYRGENLPDATFFRNTVVDNYGVPAEKVDEFRSILESSLLKAKLLSKHGDKTRVLDVTAGETPSEPKSDRIKKLERAVKVEAGESCFVMQPFANPHGSYYEAIFRPAIEKAGLKSIRADADIFGTGKIMDQVWRGIGAAKVLVCEMTTRNPNVFYELGLAHALKKPVVLVSSNEEDVPFDLHHIRVIYYDMSDPFWGQKLIEKIAENILSALKNPEEAIFKGESEARSA